MKNVYEVLRQKEMELTRLEKEVEALRLVAPLLSEEKEAMLDIAKPVLATAVNGPQPTVRIPASTATASIPARRSGGTSPAAIRSSGRRNALRDDLMAKSWCQGTEALRPRSNKAFRLMVRGRPNVNPRPTAALA